MKNPLISILLLIFLIQFTHANLHPTKTEVKSMHGRQVKLYTLTHTSSQSSRFTNEVILIEPHGTNPTADRMLLRLLTGPMPKAKLDATVKKVAWFALETNTVACLHLLPESGDANRNLDELNGIRRHLAAHGHRNFWQIRSYAFRYTVLGRVVQDTSNLMTYLETHLPRHINRRYGFNRKFVIMGASRFGWSAWQIALDDRITARNKVDSIIVHNFNFLNFEEQISYLYNPNGTRRHDWQTDIYQHLDYIARDRNKRALFDFRQSSTRNLWDYADPYRNRNLLVNVPALVLQLGTHNSPPDDDSALNMFSNYEKHMPNLNSKSFFVRTKNGSFDSAVRDRILEFWRTRR